MPLDKSAIAACSVINSNSKFEPAGKRKFRYFLYTRQTRWKATPVADDDQETCSDCREDGTVVAGQIIEFATGIAKVLRLYEQIESAKKFYSCNNNLRGFLSTLGILTSGYYIGSHHFGGQAIIKPRGKCSHGGFLDSTSDLSARGGINKDSLNEK